MVGLVRAEYRKIVTTRLWWALLIPIAVLSFFASWFGTAIGAIAEMQAAASRPIPVGLLTVSMATNFSTIFAAVFGAMSIAGEHRNRGITTTYLTATRRSAVLVAKLVTHAGVGLTYGLVNVLFASFGALLGAGIDGFGDIADWFAVGGAGVLAMVLWTLLGVGFGAMVANSVIAIIAPLGYKFVFEFVLSLYLIGSETPELGAYFPGGAGSGIVGNLAVPLFADVAFSGTGDTLASEPIEILHFFFGGNYQFPWWLSVLIFTGYTMVFVVGGWLLSDRRDIT